MNYKLMSDAVRCWKN